MDIIANQIKTDVGQLYEDMEAGVHTFDSLIKEVNRINGKISANKVQGWCYDRYGNCDEDVCWCNRDDNGE